MHFAPFFQAAVIFALFESMVCADLIERNNRYFCITDDTRRRKTSIYRAVYCNSYSLYGNIPPTSFLQSFRLPPLCLHKSLSIFHYACNFYAVSLYMAAVADDLDPLLGSLHKCFLKLRLCRFVWHYPMNSIHLNHKGN